MITAQNLSSSLLTRLYWLLDLQFFEHQTLENVNNVFEIVDIDPKVLKEMLVYMYTGKASKIEEMAEDLLTSIS